MSAIAAAEPKPSLVEGCLRSIAGPCRVLCLRRIRAKGNAADLAQEVYVRMLRISD